MEVCSLKKIHISTIDLGQFPEVTQWVLSLPQELHLVSACLLVGVVQAWAPATSETPAKTPAGMVIRTGETGSPRVPKEYGLKSTNCPLH